MMGLIVQLILSWILIWVVRKKNLGVLGLNPKINRIKDFIRFFLLTGICCSTGFLLKKIFYGQNWQINPDLNPKLFINGIWWNLKSVLFEELIFRGVLLYLLLDWLGARKAIVFSAVAFGIYHWFSYGVLGQPVQMIFLFFITGLMGIVLAYAYAKTVSIYVPVGIHFGWNFTQIFIFSGGPIGKGWIIPSELSPQVTGVLASLVSNFVPIFLALGLNYWILRRKAPENPSWFVNSQIE